MEAFNSIKQGEKDLVCVRAYRGDAMTLLAFDLDESPTENFVGFSVRVKQGERESHFLSVLFAIMNDRSKSDILARVIIGKGTRGSARVGARQSTNPQECRIWSNISQAFFPEPLFSVDPEYIAYGSGAENVTSCGSIDFT